MLTFSTSFISFLIVPVSASKSFKLKPQKRKKEVSEEKKGKNSEEERLIHDCEPRTHYKHDSRPKTEINLDGKMHLKSDVHKTRQGKNVIRNNYSILRHRLCEVPSLLNVTLVSEDFMKHNRRE